MIAQEARVAAVGAPCGRPELRSARIEIPGGRRPPLRGATLILAVCALAMTACGDEAPADRLRESASGRGWMDEPAKRITLSRRDIDIRDLARLLSARTGVPIVVGPSARGSITIDVKDTPWDEALANAIAPLGLRYDIVNGKVWITHDSSRSEVVQSQAPAGFYPVGGDVQPPKILTRVDPDYPEEARAARISGIVIIEAHIDATGRVIGGKILKGLPLGLDRAALAAVKQFTFQPGTLNGRPVPVVFIVTIRFELPKQ